MDCIKYDFVNKINEVFVSVMWDYIFLFDDVFVLLYEDDEFIMVMVDFVVLWLSKISVLSVGGFDGFLNRLLKEFLDILVLVIIEVLN